MRYYTAIVHRDEQTEVIVGNYALYVGPSNRHTVAPPAVEENTADLTGPGDMSGRIGRSPEGSGNLDTAVERDKAQTVGGNHSEYVRQDKTVTIDGN